MDEDRDRAGYGKPGDAKGSFAGRACRDRFGKFSAMRDRSKIALRICAFAQIACCVATPNDMGRRMLAGLS
jgi:hypothetical protein